MEDVVAPVDQLYDVSPEPDAVRVVEVPWQTVRVPVILTLGADVTTIARVVVAVQPLVPVPVIVQVLVVPGETVTVEPVAEKEDGPAQLYVFAPLAVNTDCAPAQIEPEEAVMVNEGALFTITFAVAVTEQLLVVPVTVYVVVVFGFTEIVEVVAPVDHK